MPYERALKKMRATWDKITVEYRQAYFFQRSLDHMASSLILVHFSYSTVTMDQYNNL